MNSDLTPNSLVRYVYNELPSTKVNQLLQAIESNHLMADTLEGFEMLKEKLDEAPQQLTKRRPHSSVIKSILDYSSTSEPAPTV